MVELALITPPVGFNLFVIQALTGKNILNISRVSLPFFLLLLIGTVLIVMFPGLATWLPRHMGGI
jgi:TRAP-type C4-dicarboxylate transport system permease large subunit